MRAKRRPGASGSFKRDWLGAGLLAFSGRLIGRVWCRVEIGYRVSP